MKTRSFFNRLTILALVAAMMFFFKPAIAQDYEEESAGVESEMDFEEDVVEPEADDSSGEKYQYTWVPATAFVPGYPGNLDLKLDGFRLAVYRNGGSNTTNGAAAHIRLPSGAYLYQIQWHYIDPVGGRLTFFGYRVPYNGTIQSLYGSQNSVAGGTVLNKTVNSAYRTIANRDYLYYAWLNFNSIGTAGQLRGARLYWYRQWRRGLSNPFNDLGGYGPVFRDAISALYQSGITTGTSPTTYGPNNFVTRAQMAVFLSKALGLHWAGSSGY